MKFAKIMTFLVFLSGCVAPLSAGTLDISVEMTLNDSPS